MNRGTPWEVALLALVLVAAPGRAAEKSGTEKTRSASTPEEAVKLVVEASRAGDVNGLLALMGEPNVTSMKASMQLLLARESFDIALDKKFGKDKQRMPPLKEQLKQTQSITVRSKRPLTKNRVEMTVWETVKDSTGQEKIKEQIWTAVKKGQGWKLLIPLSGAAKRTARKGPGGKEVQVWVFKADRYEADPRMVAYAKKLLPGYRDLYARLTHEVNEGTYRTRRAARAALASAERIFLKENPPPAVSKPRKDNP